MNRKQRRAGLKQAGSGPRQSAAQLFADALRLQQMNKLDDAARAYKRLLLIAPDHAQASNNLACILQTQGKFAEASARFARTLELMPQLLGQFGAICATLTALLPTLAGAMARASQAWPRRLPPDDLFGGAGLVGIVADPLLLTILQSTPVRDVALERVLTSVRAALLERAAANALDDDALGFCCALAQQCFINEYVFATTPAEDALVESIGHNLDGIAPTRLAALAMYLPLHELTGAEALLSRQWPEPVDDVVTLQLREPLAERALRQTIPQLTAIEDATSQRVRQMYEENPYPRWIQPPAGAAPLPIDRYLRGLFPAATFNPPAPQDTLDVLVAGCGTGWHAIGLAHVLQGARITAIDLSRGSLAYAKHKTPTALAAHIDYAQADILKLGALERRFDVIDASGVLHHMADPFAGWRILLGLLRPNGVMHLGLYSELGRRDVLAARGFIRERGYGATAAEIRRCRQELLESPHAGVARFDDFFSTSECRDLLFHVQESRTSIPAIKAFLDEQNLTFIGFEFGEAAQRGYQAWFAQRGWPLGDLKRWHEFETQYPDTFSAMYHFWVQKPGPLAKS